MSAPAEGAHPAFATLAACRRPSSAPDGWRVPVLLGLNSGSMATFTLRRGQASAAVTHRTVAELRYGVSGCGPRWRCDAVRWESVALESGLCLSVPLGATFYFRCDGDTPLMAVAVAVTVTVPPWPG
jgi:mannose-6-phosphate isomerase-like protein (cupin superfamily)